MANPPDQLDKLNTAWLRLQRFVNTGLGNLADRADAVRKRATNGKSDSDRGK